MVNTEAVTLSMGPGSLARGKLSTDGVRPFGCVQGPSCIPAGRKVKASVDLLLLRYSGVSFFGVGWCVFNSGAFTSLEV